MTLNAERLYPTTITEFNIDAGPEGVLRIGSTGTNDDVPLSAGGSLLLSAREIHQGGHVLAPFGSIRLAGTDSVELLDGSVTSVAAVGALLPFGRVDLGEQWLYGGVTQDAIPERRVEIESANVKLASGASVDLRGGGDLYAYNWVPGTGGSRDVLDTAAGNGYYAILPSLRGQLTRLIHRNTPAPRCVPATASIYRRAQASTRVSIHCCRRVMRCCRARCWCAACPDTPI
jgi:hypothetical protein